MEKGWITNQKQWRFAQVMVRNIWWVLFRKINGFQSKFIGEKVRTVCTFKTILIFFHCRYILLKERNRIMTLESELERQGLYMTDAWRMEKVSQNNQILHFSWEQQALKAKKVYWEKNKESLLKMDVHVLVFGISVSRLLYNNLFLKIVNFLLCF